MPRILTSFLLALLVWPGLVAAQGPDDESTWTGTASAGLALTSGNKDTSTFNAGYEFEYDAGTRNTIKSDALYIRGETESSLSTDRLAVTARDQYRFSDDFFLFGQNRYLRDRFKEIDYLVAPTVGVGYQVFNSSRSSLTLDVGLGGVWEKNRNRGVRSSGAVTIDQKLTHRMTESATVAQSVSLLWKTGDFGDSLTTIGASLAVSVTSRTQVKLEWVDTYKSRPPTSSVQKNDLSVLVALVYKH